MPIASLSHCHVLIGEQNIAESISMFVITPGRFVLRVYNNPSENVTQAKNNKGQYTHESSLTSVDCIQGKGC